MVTSPCITAGLPELIRPASTGLFPIEFTLSVPLSVFGPTFIRFVYAGRLASDNE